MNLFFSINESYYKQLAVTITSILENDRSSSFHFFVLNSGLSYEVKAYLEKLKLRYKNFDIEYPTVSDSLFNALKLNIDYISKETYFRYVIADLFPGMNKALYLDADIAVVGSLVSFYHTDIQDYYCAAVKDFYIESLKYKSKIGFQDDDLYVNAGVLLLNLEKMRQDNISEKFFSNTEKFAASIKYQDQDIINLTLKGKIKEIDSIYNFAVHNIRKDVKKRKSAIILHYTGAQKPWDEECKNKLKYIWEKYSKIMLEVQGKKIKVGLIIDEFFGGAETTFGGYGFLARKYIAKYIPNENVQIDVLLGRGKKFFLAKKFHEDDVDLYKLPRNRFFAKRWLKKQNYDIYLSIELVHSYVLENEPRKDKKLILWVQDPRPQYEWDEIATMTLVPEKCYYDQKIYDLVHHWNENNRVQFISQGHFLNQKAKDLYNLPDHTDIQYLPNPIKTDDSFDIKTYQKEKKIIFLGRLEDVKRGWIFCEIAKQMPEYEFQVLGKTNILKSETNSIFDAYKNIPNLHFVGHVEDEVKEKYMKDAKILVNTSIHEALPISFLEALSYGTVLVSNRNPEDLTEKFGIWVGDVLGDGFDKIDLYVNAIKELMENDELRSQKSINAIEYIKENHSIDSFIKDMRNLIYKETQI